MFHRLEHFVGVRIKGQRDETDTSVTTGNSNVDTRASKRRTRREMNRTKRRRKVHAKRSRTLKEKDVLGTRVTTIKILTGTKHG